MLYEYFGFRWDEKTNEGKLLTSNDQPFALLNGWYVNQVANESKTKLFMQGFGFLEKIISCPNKQPNERKQSTTHPLLSLFMLEFYGF